MQPSSIILCEGVLSLAVPLGLAAWELRALRKPPGGGPRWAPDPAPPSRPSLPDAAPPPTRRERVLEDA